MPPAAIASSVRRVISSVAARRGGTRAPVRGGNFGARPKPPQRRVEDRARDFSVRCRAGRPRAGRSTHVGATGADVLGEVRARAVHLVAARVPCLGDREQHLRERGQPVARLRREVGAAEERLAVRRQEHGHRPAAAAGQRDDRIHVDRVEVGALLAIDLDADEALVHHAGRRRVLERLALHDMAPVARRIADRQEDRAALVARARECLVTPRIPVDGVRGVLQQIRRRLLREAVHRLRSRLAPSTASVSAPAMPNATRSATQAWSRKNRPPK